MFKTVDSHIQTLQLEGFTLTAEGILEEPYNWTIIMTYPNNLLGARMWTRREYCWDADEAEEMVWEEAMSLIKKYAVQFRGVGKVEIEVDEEEVSV